MPTIEITSNQFYINVPIKLDGNVGIGTTIPLYPLDMKGAFEFDIDASLTSCNVFGAGLEEKRSLCVSDDGNTVVAGFTDNGGSYQTSVGVYTNNNSVWTSNILQIQSLPVGIYSGSIFQRTVSQAYISGDGTRIVASKGAEAGQADANVVEIFHKIAGQWVSKAFIHHEGYLGFGCAISGDGNTVALTSPKNQFGNNFPGTVYVYTYNSVNDTWDQSFSREYDNWVDRITLNYDGTKMAFSRTKRKYGGNYLDASTCSIHILQFTNGAWNNVNDDIIITPPGTVYFWHYYGKSIKFSSEGNTLVVGAPGSNDMVSNNNLQLLSKVFVYKNTGVNWSSYTSYTLQLEYPYYMTLDAAYSYAQIDMFGNEVSITSDEKTILIAGPYSYNISANINSDGYGKVWVYHFVNNSWVLKQIIQPASNSENFPQFGYSACITRNGKYIYIGGNRYYSQQNGINQYSLTKYADTMNIKGNIITNQSIGIGTTAPSAKLQLHTNSTAYNRDLIKITNDTSTLLFVNKNGNLGIGTDNVTYPLYVKGTSNIHNYSSYTSITYEDYTAWTAFTNRTNITITNTDDSTALLNDFGFDFFINNQNIRNSSYVGTNGYISFGQSVMMYNAFNVNANRVIALYVGANDNQVYSISYYSGLYEGVNAFYVFYDGSDYGNNGASRPNKWCAIFKSDNTIKVFINNVQNDTRVGLGIGYGDGGQSWLVELPGNYSIPSTPITNTAYSIIVDTRLRKNAVYTDGDVIMYGNMISQGNVGIGTTLPETALVVNGTIRNINGPSPTSGTSLVITGNGDIAPQSSDARYKTRIEDIHSVLDDVMNLRAVSYRWKEEPQKWYGLLAQQVAEVFPDAAWHDVEKDTFGVHYTPTIVTLLLKAMQEMKQSYDTRIANLEQKFQ